ncbi:MAG: RagB/SusD family nutrient uptake outer membrane protein [Ferruginibacter sp.]
MKRLSIGLISGLLLLFVSCQKLDIKPVNQLSDDQIFTSEAGISVYMANLYRNLPIEDFRYGPANTDGLEGSETGFNPTHSWKHFYHAGAACGEMVGPWGGMNIGGGFGYWPYADIRAVNYFLETLPKYASNYNGNRVNELLGEAHFLRAYYYFGLAKRYGGVPIVARVQNYPQETIDELKVPRNTEEETWNFIGDDLDSAFNMMTDVKTAGRGNKYVAAALQSRAMVYAGSIAKYGSENFVDGDARALGYVGIPAEKAAGYYNRAIDAAKKLEASYSLYQASANLEQNYVDLFLDGYNKDNPEIIFSKGYNPTLDVQSPHSWDATFCPRYFTGGGLSRSYPTLDLVERFGILNVTNADGTPKRYNSLSEVGRGLEPRLKATIFFPGDTLKGRAFDDQNNNGIFDVRRGIYKSFTGTAVDEAYITAPTSPSDPGTPRPMDQRLAGGRLLLADDPNTQDDGKTIIGRVGVKTGSDDMTRTGFYVRKYINYKTAQNKIDLFTSSTAWIELRYAEVLLNRAEADIETGQFADALECLKKIRKRAGAAEPTMADMTPEFVQNERCKELAFENHYWWDIKRWRVADKILNNARFRALLPYFVKDENKYIFIKERETFDRNYYFDKRFYYEPIPQGEINKNSNLAPQNPGY